MKVKVKFLDIDLLKSYCSFLTIVSLVFSFVFIFVEIPNKYKLVTGGVFLLLMIIIYLYFWIRSNTLTKMRLVVNNSIVNIKIGDIFNETDLKVIAFNEYFDTQVDNRIISEKSLNGIFLKNVFTDCGLLDNLINTNDHLNNRLLESNVDREKGKKNRYRLGTVLELDNYLLTAFSKFDNNNRAYLDINDFVNFLLNFWNEIDMVYSGRSVSIPLLGSGITRIKEYNDITDQELLELLIWSFKISRIKFTYPSLVTIVIHDSKKDKINFYKLKGIG